jgi:hypothetical protein
LPSTQPKLRKHDAAAGQPVVPEFHQLNVKAWLIRRIQIALITRYVAIFGCPHPGRRGSNYGLDWQGSRAAV